MGGKTTSVNIITIKLGQNLAGHTGSVVDPTNISGTRGPSLSILPDLQSDIRAPNKNVFCFMVFVTFNYLYFILYFKTPDEVSSLSG